ncbi:MAG: ABC transporter ATP-binding protein [Rhizobiales bacterium 62-17]|nr:ABC transporter ATP-binding protein [Hyphomicrobiales bacterium]OJY04436.1 MAG: ABC transporter ATP-binding protein [Rhizobiales bacterium 62-17]
MLKVENIYTNYGSSQVLQDLSLEVKPGEIVGILGRNGVGKTTLMRSIMGLTPPRSGRILFDGADITRMAPHRIARLGLGYVPQGRRVFPSLSVREHLQVTAREREASPWTFAKMIELFPNLGQRLDQSGAKLSGGEQQMLAAGRALVANPTLLLMDEPTEGLAPLMVRELGRLVGALKDSGTAVLLVEQQLAFVLKYADRVYIVAKGQIVHHCLPAELATDSDVKARYLGV